MPCSSVKKARVVTSIVAISSVRSPAQATRETQPVLIAMRVWRCREEGLGLVLVGGIVLVLAPGPVHAGVGIVFCLPRDRVAVAEQELLVGIVLEVIVAADVDHGRSLHLRRCQAFAAV